MQLSATTYQLDQRPEFPFRVLGRRYINNRSPNGRYTLIFLHALSTHKETWEPVISHLFSIADGGYADCLVREAWSIGQY
jgi:hypothetical protein